MIEFTMLLSVFKNLLNILLCIVSFIEDEVNGASSISELPSLMDITLLYISESCETLKLVLSLYLSNNLCYTLMKVYL